MTQSKDAVALHAPMPQEVNGSMLGQALTWFVDGRIFNHLRFHGNTKWDPLHLVFLAILWVWSDKATLTGAFAEALRSVLSFVRAAPELSFQGFMGALNTWTSQLLPLLWEQLHARMEDGGGTHWRLYGWLPLAVDGSRISTPRSQANEKAFCAPNYGQSNSAKYRKRKKKKAGQRRRRQHSEPVKPQIWTTLMWHMGLGLPWCWKTGPSTSSERDHFRDMLAAQSFPKDTLFCADAGFTGYDLWQAIRAAGHHFLIRVGANVKLLRRLGYVRESAGLVYFWPDKAARKQQPPLVLRLWHFQLGRCQMYVVSSVVDEEKMSAEQVKELYKLRWGIELQFRTLKQTFGRRKLRSKTPANAYVELDWSLLGLSIIQLFAVKEQIAVGEAPTKISVAQAIRVIQDMCGHCWEVPPRGVNLASRLREAVCDQYKRKGSKRARYRPNYKDKPAAGAPKVVDAQEKHQHWLRKYEKTLKQNP